MISAIECAGNRPPFEDASRTGKVAFGSFAAFASSVALVVLIAVASPKAHAQSNDTTANDLRVAEALFASGRFIDALVVLRPHLVEGTVGEEGLFLYGLAAVAQAERMPEGNERDALLDSAVEIFHAMLVVHPDNPRVRLELARTFFLKEEDGLARQHFERVLAGNPPAAVVANIERYLAAIKARRRWSASFSFSVAPDSNINTASNQEIVYIWGLPFTLDDPNYSESGVGFYVGGQAEYEHPLTDRTRLRLGAAVSRTEYSGSDYDSMNLRLHMGPRYFVDSETEVSMLAEAEQNWSAGTPYSRGLGVRLEGIRRLGNQLRLSADAGWMQRYYLEEDREYLDGPVSDFNLRFDYRMTSTLQAFLKGGVRYDRPEGSEERHSDTSLASIGLSGDLPRGFTLAGSGTWLKTKYDGLSCCPETLDGEPRSDSKRIWRLSVLHRDFTILGFSPELSYVRESLDSNAQAVDYVRDRGELQFVKQF